MKKIFAIIFFILALFNSSPVLALSQASSCIDHPNDCPTGTTCRRVTENHPENGLQQDEYRCLGPDSANSGAAGVFGSIVPPASIVKFGFGAEGLSSFLSNLILLIYSISAVVFIFMIIWGAFDWITSEGDKEKVGKARSKIINALVGIVIFAIAFAVIQVLGVFTGFSFFVGQKTGT